MSQGFREMLANRRFAIPLIVLLAFCFIGLILVGIVLILRPGEGDNGGPVAQVTTPAATATQTQPVTFTPSPTATRTPRPSPTLVPMGTVGSGTAEPDATASPTATEVGSPLATATPASGGSAVSQETATPVAQDDELADTGLGWGLIIFSGLGLAILLAGARRLRMAS
ncbi:MAG: hypothetical protein ACK2UC_08375 [Anaerolineae bacterium]|jgi:hypothetical protein